MGLLTANRSRTPAVALILFEHPWATLVLMAVGLSTRADGKEADRLVARSPQARAG
jgi:hypothetical protein